MLFILTNCTNDVDTNVKPNNTDHDIDSPLRINNVFWGKTLSIQKITLLGDALNALKCQCA